MPLIANASLSGVSRTTARVTFRIDWAAVERVAGTPWDLLITFWGQDDSFWDRTDDVLRRFGRPLAANGLASQDVAISFTFPSGTLNEDIFGDEVYAVIELLPVPRDPVSATARTNLVRGGF